MSTDDPVGQPTGDAPDDARAADTPAAPDTNTTDDTDTTDAPDGTNGPDGANVASGPDRTTEGTEARTVGRANGGDDRVPPPAGEAVATGAEGAATDGDPAGLPTTDPAAGRHTRDTPEAAPARAANPAMAGRFSLRRRVRLTFAVALVLALLLSIAGSLAFRSLLDAREALVDRADPALQASTEMLAGLVDQETGIRAYVLSADDTFLEPYNRGAEAADDAHDDLVRLTRDVPEARDQLRKVDEAVAAWRDGYAEPTRQAVANGEAVGRDDAALSEGRALFDDIRAEIGTLQDQLTAERTTARDRLNAVTFRLLMILTVTAVVLAAVAAVLWLLMRRGVEEPLRQLGGDAQHVAGGDLGHPIRPVGPIELATVAEAMERMRERIVTELAAVVEARDALERQADDLARSNSELEQFAYVASHDLQEPLRKVASFCQLLQSRYGGQLDERADQYIAFAVDGAKRMQALINDLLAFSRVGRHPDDAVEVRAGQLIDEALENLSSAIQTSDARVTVVGPLPRVRIETSLGVALFQNLISNALKFRKPDEPPSIHISARRDDDFVEITVSDEGIGIPPEYVDRIFIIFQRLHGRDDYAGTGIGLALCRKIVEARGGRIWVDTEEHPDKGSGTTIRFTLPAVEGDA